MHHICTNYFPSALLCIIVEYAAHPWYLKIVWLPYIYYTRKLPHKQTYVASYRYQLRCSLQTKVISKSKVGSLTMHAAKHDVTGMTLHQMYPYLIRFSTLWLAIHALVLLVNAISKIILESLKNFVKYREILPKDLRNNLKIFKRKIGKFRELLRKISRNISSNFENYIKIISKNFW